MSSASAVDVVAGLNLPVVVDDLLDGGVRNVPILRLHGCLGLYGKRDSETVMHTTHTLYQSEFDNRDAAAPTAQPSAIGRIRSAFVGTTVSTAAQACPTSSASNVDAHGDRVAKGGDRSPGFGPVVGDVVQEVVGVVVRHIQCGGDRRRPR